MKKQGALVEADDPEDASSYIPKHLFEQVLEDIDGEAPATNVEVFTLKPNAKVEFYRAIRMWARLYLVVHPDTVEAKRAELAKGRK